jgi:membrane protein DedA with SNARE-associated domain
MTGDLFWFWVGLQLRERGGIVTHWARKIAGPFDEHLRERTFHTIFLSKFIYGVHHAILIRAGMLRMRLDKFIKIDFASSVTWIVVVGGLGFISSLSFDRIRHQIKFLEGALLIAFIGFLLISYLISYEAKRKL